MPISLCENCREEIDENSLNYIDGEDYYVCNDCYQTDFSSCEQCNTLFHISHLSESCYCENCEESGNSDNVHSHNYQPHYNYHQLKNEKNVFYLGFELEIATYCRGNYISDIYLADWLYLKEDASILENDAVSNGCEIVSHPCSWEYLLSKKDELKSLLLNLAKNGWNSYKSGTCGLHIHLSKRPLSSFHLYKIQKFIYDWKNFLFLLKFSRRSENNLKRWASLSTVHNKEQNENKGIVSIAKDKWQVFRYTAINLHPSKTVEFRLFRGTLNFDSFWRCFEFVHSLIKYTEFCGLQDIDFNHYKTFVANNKKEYKNLHNWIENYVSNYY